MSIRITSYNVCYTKLLRINVDTFARWRITDPVTYYKKLRDERSALSRLDDIIGSATRDRVAAHDLIELVRNDKDRVPEKDETLIEGNSSIGTRITSYNVCYTKLLRGGREVVGINPLENREDHVRRTGIPPFRAQLIQRVAELLPVFAGLGRHLEVV